MEFALGIIVGVLVAAAADALVSLWLAAHSSRVAARVLSAELAQHRLALDRWLNFGPTEDCTKLPESDARYEATFGQVEKASGRPIPYLPTSAWDEFRASILATASNEDAVALVGYYQPVADRALLAESQLGPIVTVAFAGAAETVERLDDRSRFKGFLLLLRGPARTKSD